MEQENHTAKDSQVDLRKTIEQQIHEHNIMVYIRGNPEAPRCGFTRRVLDTLRAMGEPYGYQDMDPPQGPLWNTLKEMNGWPTAPQIYVGGEFVGGCDLFCEMHRSGELKEKLEKLRQTQHDV